MVGLSDEQVRASLVSQPRMQSLAETGLDAAPDPTFDRFADMVCTVLGVPVSLVSMVDPTRQFFPGAAGLAEPWARQRQTPLSHSFCQQAVVSGEPLIVSDARRDDRVCGNPAIDDLGVVGYADAPLLDADGRVLGALCAIDHQPRQWTDRELNLLADLAAACSDSLQLRIATYHAQAERTAAQDLTRRLRVAFDRSQLLLQASAALTSSSTVRDVVDAVHQMVGGSFHPANIGVVLLDDDGRLRIASSDPLPSDVVGRWLTFPTAAAVPAAETFRSGRLIALADPEAIAAAFPQGAADLQHLGWQAIACAPIPGLTGPLGVLTFAWAYPHEIDVNERATIAAIAGYVGQALLRARHFDRQTTAATTLQKALLTPLPVVGRLRMAARYLPAHHGDHVGGDWYDALALPEQRLALVIGDVTGHSLDAAAAMSQLRSMLRGFLVDRVEPPSALLRRLEQANRALTADTIATVLLAYLDPTDQGGHRLHWSNAGHPPPMVIHPDGSVDQLCGADPLIGVTRQVSRTNRTLVLKPGTTLLLHTDGLVETRTETLDQGFERLRRLLTGHYATAPQDLADLLLRHADAHAHEDDVALLVLRTPDRAYSNVERSPGATSIRVPR
jgi:serine phosphatase RsbU (regulator of sigma subunit)